MILLLVFASMLAKESFLLVDDSGKTIYELGSQLEESMSPCSTFKIPLSLMGYDTEILTDEHTPILTFQEDYDDFLDAWKDLQSPTSWMQCSCVWYSKLLSCKLGLEIMQRYLTAFNYGNQELPSSLVMPGKEDPAWFPSSSLRISPR